MRISRHPGWAIPTVLGVAALALLGGRFLVAARHAVAAAEAARARGDLAEATRSYLDALRCYVPGSPYEGKALDGLDEIAVEAAHSGDVNGERRALEALRRGLLGTRSLFMPYPARFAKASSRLAQLDATVDFPPAVPPRIIRPRIYDGGRRGTASGPAIAATLVALGGFAAWVLAIVVLIRRGVPRDPDLRDLRTSRASGAAGRVLASILFVVGFALFLIGLRFA